MPTVPAGVPSNMPRLRTVFAVFLLPALLLGTALTGCAYEYDDGPANWTESPSPPAFTDAAITRDPRYNQPVSGAELDAWVTQALPDAEGQVFHSNYGTLEPGVEREEDTATLPEGSYAITLACRSPRRVSFSVGHNDSGLVDLNLRCGTSRVNVVFLPANAVLHIEVKARVGANFAYRVSRL
jgi:hypothetical protein